MVEIKIDKDKLKSTTEDYFNAFYINLLFSSDKSMTMEFNYADIYNDKLLFVTNIERTITSEEDFSNNRFKTRRAKLNEKKITESVYLDYDYLMELVNSNGLELKYLDSTVDFTDIKYQLSYSTMEEELKKKKEIV